MIFVTLGTQDKEFKRLLEAVDDQIEKGNIKEEVVAQIGCTKYTSNNMKLYDYLDQDDFNKYLKKCSLLITHGGVGSILSALKINKTVIAAPRLKKYKEHVNDHQTQIIESFSKEKYILGLMDFDKFPSVLEKAKTFKPKKFASNTDNLIEHIENYIDSI
jgi:UDP-N-acetylglucosamine transferase subunit ALG13